MAEAVLHELDIRQRAASADYSTLSAHESRAALTKSLAEFGALRVPDHSLYVGTADSSVLKD